jgi:hypothetical protein
MWSAVFVTKMIPWLLGNSLSSFVYMERGHIVQSAQVLLPLKLNI